MTPGARVQAAIECLDEILAGGAAEKVLTGWARRSRFAGSKDRAAVRDHVFDVLRQRNSLAGAVGRDGRALMIGLLRQQGIAPEQLFSGTGYGPEALSASEIAGPGAVSAIDLPEWLIPLMRDSLGAAFEETEHALRHRAPVFLRVNPRKCDLKQAIESLASDGVVAGGHPLSPTALEVFEGARRVSQTDAYRQGWVELQDAASQALTDTLPIHAGDRVLDFCAGGGGKSLAMAARVDAHYTAHDVNPARMKDIPARAARAGVSIALTQAPDGAYDLVLCDAPCSGSGAWRRSPEGKWLLTPERLAKLTQIQDGILDRAVGLVAASGVLAYATCSLLDAENGARIAAFLARHPGWACQFSRQWHLSEGGDGFFVAHLTRMAE